MAEEEWEEEIESEPESHEDHRKEAPGWIAGGVLLMLGLLLLVSNITGAPFNNWWALFILIPALGSLYIALRNYGQTGAMTESVRKPLTGGLILFLVSLMFLFEIDWSRFWPFLLIIVGGTLLLGAAWPRR
jgi:hypothetical protein